MQTPAVETTAERVVLTADEEVLLALEVLVPLAVGEVELVELEELEEHPIPNQVHQKLLTTSRCSRARFWRPAAAVAVPVTLAVAVVETATLLTREAV